MSQKVMRVGALTAGPPHHIVDVEVEGDSITVKPEYLLIHAGESVQWCFRGIQDERRPEIRFINPAEKQCGPFGKLSPGCYQEARDGVEDGVKVYTITGPSADTTPCRYEYEAGVTVKDTGKWIGVDPVIDNEGGPPGVAGG
jgi:hypothetical protein